MLRMSAPTSQNSWFLITFLWDEPPFWCISRILRQDPDVQKFLYFGRSPPWQLIWHSFWPSGSIYWIQILNHSVWWHSFWHSILASILTYSDILSGILSGIVFCLAIYLASCLAFFLTFSLPCALSDLNHERPGLRSGRAHWDLELAVGGGRRKEEGWGSNCDKI